MRNFGSYRALLKAARALAEAIFPDPIEDSRFVPVATVTIAGWLKDTMQDHLGLGVGLTDQELLSITADPERFLSGVSTVAATPGDDGGYGGRRKG